MLPGMTLDPSRTAVLALHWQVNVIEPHGFFGGMLAGTLLGGSWSDRSATRTLQWMLGTVAVALAAFSVTAPWWVLSLVPLLAAATAARAWASPREIPSPVSAST